MADVVIPGKEAVSEHRNLVKVLRSGDKSVMSKEAGKQSGELRKYRKIARKSERSDGR
jgi:hypothetical protein